MSVSYSNNNNGSSLHGMSGVKMETIVSLNELNTQEKDQNANDLMRYGSVRLSD